MTSPLENGTALNACLYGACPELKEFDGDKGHTEIENGVELSFYSEEGSAILNKCLATAGCFLTLNEEEDEK